jgi:hypothetical protein
MYAKAEQLKLSEFLRWNGINTKAADLQITSEDEVSVNFSSETDFGSAIIPLLAEMETLFEVNALCSLLNICTEQRRAEIYNELQSGNTDTILTILDAIKELNGHTKTPNIEQTDVEPDRGTSVMMTI